MPQHAALGWPARCRSRLAADCPMPGVPGQLPHAGRHQLPQNTGRAKTTLENTLKDQKILKMRILEIHFWGGGTVKLKEPPPPD